MIEMFSNFASSLVAAIIAITIAEMLLPNSKNKKYVTFVSTMILCVVIINPIISLLNQNVNIEDFLEKQETEIASSEYTAKMEYAKEKSINDMYRDALKQDIITRLKDNGYIVKNISFEIDSVSYEPTKMELEIEHKDGDIEKVVIDVSSNISEDISLVEKAKVKDILYSAYHIDRKNIRINHN